MNKLPTTLAFIGGFFACCASMLGFGEHSALWIPFALGAVFATCAAALLQDQQ